MVEAVGLENVDVYWAAIDRVLKRKKRGGRHTYRAPLSPKAYRCFKAKATWALTDQRTLGSPPIIHEQSSPVVHSTW